MNKWERLPREEVIRAVERNCPSRVPMIVTHWWGEGLEQEMGDRLHEFDVFPRDHEWVLIHMIDPMNMKLSWTWEQRKAADSTVVIDDWGKLDEFIEKLPHPATDPQLDKAAERVRKGHADGVYVHFGWWNLFFEKPWSLRGMQNIMTDHYEHPDEIHKLHKALCDTYVEYIEWASAELPFDGFWSSDDLGHQHGPMMDPAVFDEFLQPYYNRVGAALRKHSKHFWLHSCGDNTLLMDKLIAAGVDVFHPVQKGTMDSTHMSEQFGDKLCFLAGFDVQQTLWSGTPEQVRREVRWLIDTFDRPDGGMCIAAGNGIVGGTPFENIRAFLEEAAVYGQEHRQNFAEA